MRMRIAVKLGGAFTLLALLIVSLTVGVVSVTVYSSLNAEATRRVHNDVDVTRHIFDYFAQDARQIAQFFGSNQTLVAALRANIDATTAQRAAQLHGIAPNNIVSVYETDGHVVYDGGTLANRDAPRRHPAALGLALAGEESIGFTVFPDETMGLEATLPIRAKNGDIEGAIRVGRRLDDAFVDQLKAITGLEVGIAEGDSLNARWLAITLKPDGQARLGGDVPTSLITDLRNSEHDRPIRRTLRLAGADYLAALAPLRGAYGEFVGTLVIAEPLEPIQRTIIQTIGTIVGVALGLLLISVLAIRVFSRGLTRPIAQLADQATRIAQGHLHEQVVVKTGDELETLAIAFNRMSEALIEMQFRDQNANPLTKLPGNLLIEAEINRRLQAGEPVAVLYLDLDHFKAFNDKYGFEQGDRVIKLTAEIMREVAGENAPANPNFVGHIGGDDFIIVTRPEAAEGICTLLCRLFDERIKGLYPPEDAARGYIVSVDRQGTRQSFPLCSISIAWVDNDGRLIKDFLELSSLAAEIKKLAKRQPGSGYARDRRVEQRGVGDAAPTA